MEYTAVIISQSELVPVTQNFELHSGTAEGAHSGVIHTVIIGLRLP